MEANRVWCQRAAVLVVVLARKVFTHNGKPNPVHSFDAGSAWENLVLQATSIGLVAHGMAGFSFAKARSLLQVPDHFDVAAMIVVGRPADPAELPAELREREVLNSRRPVAEGICEGLYDSRRNW
jgi:nitroreductase